MLDHVSLTVSDLPTAERFYDAVFAALGVVKVGSDHDDAWIGYGERCDEAHPDRSYFSVRKGPLQLARRSMHFGRREWRTEGPTTASLGSATITHHIMRRF